MAAVPYQGREFVIIYDASVVGMGTDFDFSVDKKTIDITTLASAGWMQNLPTDKSWNINFNGVVSKNAGDSSRGYTYIMNSIQTSDASVTVAICPSASNNTYWSGAAILTNVKMSGGVGKLVTFSGVCIGTGPLSQFTS